MSSSLDIRFLGITAFLFFNIMVPLNCFQFQWLPGYAPPPIGDTFNDHYSILKGDASSNMLGVMILNTDGTRFVPEAHPWDADGMWDSQPGSYTKYNRYGSYGSGWSALNFLGNYMIPINAISYSKGDASGVTEWCHTFRKTGARATFRYNTENKNHVIRKCTKTNKKHNDNGVNVLYEIFRNGFAIFDGFSFTQDLKGDKKYIGFYPSGSNIYFEMNRKFNDMVIKSPYFQVLGETFRPYQISLVKETKRKVIANTPFTLEMKIENEQKNVIDKSKYANMECMISISFVNKIFTEYEGMLYLSNTTAHLGGSEVSKLWNTDEVMFVQFKSGKANATVIVKDSAPQLDLNITLKQNTYNYKAFPNNAILKNVKMLSNGKFTYNYNAKKPFSATKIIQLEVVDQEPHTLRIVPGYNIDKLQTLNFPIRPTLQVELLDKNNKRVTSGPNSKLMVTAVGGRNSELSKDSSFPLHRGIGTFAGSMLKRILDTTLSFKVTLAVGTELSTDKTGTFDVKNKYIGIMYDNTRTTEYFAKFAKHRLTFGYAQYIEAVMGGTREALGFKFDYDTEYSMVWLGDHVCKRIKSAQDIINAAEDVRKSYRYKGDSNVIWRPSTTFEQAPDVRYVALIGSDNTNTEQFATTAGAYGIMTVSDACTNDKFKDKKKYQNLVRIAFSDENKYTMMANFFQNRNWNYIIIITGKKQTIPVAFSDKLNHFKIKYYNIKFDKDNFYEKIKLAGLRILVNLLEGDDIIAMVEEIMKNKVTEEYGYTWITEGGIFAKGYPLSSGYKTTKLGQQEKQKWLQAFNGAFAFKTNYEYYHMDSNKAYQRLASYEQIKLRHKEEEFRNPYFMFHDATSLVLDAIIRAQLKGLTLNPTNLRKLMLTYREKISGVNAGDKENLAEYNILGENIRLDANYDRTGYECMLSQIDKDNKEMWLVSKRILTFGNNVTLDTISPTNQLVEISADKIKYSKTQHSQPITINYPMNIDRKLKRTVNKPVISFKEVAPLPFYCASGCGGRKINTTHWENGECIWKNIIRCKCKSGYSEATNCKFPICDGCTLDAGTCVSPKNCSCNRGYQHTNASLSDCAVYHCYTDGQNCSKNGQCVGGDNCKCDPNFWGKKCKNKCSCKNMGVCDDKNTGTGACTCQGRYFGSECTLDAVVIGIVVGSIVLAILILVIYYVRKRVKQMIEMDFLMNTDWQADWDDIRLRQQNQKSSVKSVISMLSMLSMKSGKEEAGKIFFQNQANWNGREIVVKIIRKEKMDLSPEVRMEIKEVREMHHPNLCAFIGACLEAPHICILNEVCGKGSLEDILSNDDINLGWDFRYSMLKDICRGMSYIANSEIGAHGRLKSSNCLVDNRWCVKISDFGLWKFKSDQYGIRMFSPEEGIGVEMPDDRELEGCDYYNLLWTAPEIIKTGVSHINHVRDYRTNKGDIYSFAIIMVEMCTRQHPYHELSHLRSDAIVQMLGHLLDPCKNAKLVECRDLDNDPIHVIRPQINEDDLPDNIDQADGLMALIECCWNEDPRCRPDFSTLGKCLNRISPHRGELMDNLLILMEQYTGSLEAIVAERTADLMEEKAKIDSLLSKMLPPMIAEELKVGKNPVPEYFNNVTIYFSDVVGFGMLCSQATPFEVVDILNGLYSIMDNVMDMFDCYKVETIGDCYVVVSGLPVRNGDRHAGEIASMALELLQSFNGVSYVGYENKQVQLRIGINSGPIVAGVVGLKMPRYCLFGDTMNTASRMESGGFALKIHMSADTFNVLEKLGGYITECRGEIQVKGRGAMTTYWLKGKEGVDYKLPSEDMALSASQHHFK